MAVRAKVQVDVGSAGNGDDVLRALSALANPQRLRIIATLAGGRAYVSELARTVGLSRPLVHMHLQKLEAAGLVAGSLELSPDGKAMKYFDVLPFSFDLTPTVIAGLAATLSHDQTAAPSRAAPSRRPR